jgi:hypothetical protein
MYVQYLWGLAVQTRPYVARALLLLILHSLYNILYKEKTSEKFQVQSSTMLCT